jgi:hypothetical protein
LSFEVSSSNFLLAIIVCIFLQTCLAIIAQSSVSVGKVKKFYDFINKK